MVDTVRTPTIGALVNGTAVQVAALEVTRNNYWSPDTWSADLVIADMPAGYGLNFWSRTAPILVTLNAGFVGGPGISTVPQLISGNVDVVRVNLSRGLIYLAGRDLTAAMVEARTTATFLNQTSAQIVSTIAARHGLPVVATATSIPAGQYYNNTTTIRDHQTEWELLTDLARREGFDIYIQAGTLYFQPATPGKTISIPYQVPTPAQPIASGGFIDAEIKRQMLLNGNITVTVISWNNKNKQSITGTATQSGNGGQDATYTFRVPGLTQDQATKLAHNNLLFIAAHAFSIDIDIPFDPTISPRDIIALTGTSSLFDTSYFINEVCIRINHDEGATMRLNAKLAPSTTGG